MNIEANAKINLTLDVLLRRDDGYHELDMIMLPLNLSDTLCVRVALEDRIYCDSQDFPLDESNTIYQAIHYMREAFALSQHFNVEVIKRIPMQAGLAGGSADGAAMMKAIIQLCNIQASESTYLSIAKKIGADVPFCFVNKPSRVKGIGEKVTTFQYDCPFELLLVKPKEGVSTGLAFQQLDFKTCLHPDVEACEQALLQSDYDALCDCLGNTLEQSALQITPVIANIKTQLQEDGFDAVLMSGSGSTVFAITRNSALIDKVIAHYQKQYDFACKCTILK